MNDAPWRCAQSGRVRTGMYQGLDKFGAALWSCSHALSSIPEAASGSPGPANVDLQQVTPPPGASVFLSINWDGDVTSHHCYEESVKPCM